MKHIFKKLHKGSSSGNSNPPEPNRSNYETPTPVSSSSVSDQRPIPGNSAASPSSPSLAAALSPVSTTATTDTNRADYFSSEEEYQMQLALAISASNSDFRNDSEKDQIRAATLMSLGRHGMESAVEKGETRAEPLSRQYWEFNVLDYEEKVINGFYDVYGLSIDPLVRGKMPSLEELEANPQCSGLEVVVVNQTVDPALEELVQIARCIALDCSTGEVGVLAQRLAELVTDNMGGPVKDANVMLARWMERSSEWRMSRHTSMLPLGSLNIGLSRHRALLFKVLADSIKLPCRLVKGSHYTGVEDDAVNIIKLEDGREFLVDLMGEPGTLIPADALSSKDSTFKSYIPNITKVHPSVGSEVVYSTQKPLIDDCDGSSKNSAHNRGASDKNVSFGMAEFVPSSSGFGDNGVSGALNKVSSGNPLDNLSSAAVGASFYKGARGAHAIGESVRMNVNIIPYAQNNAEDSKNLFSDLNPFQVIGSSKSFVQNKSADNQADEFQRQRNSIVSCQPPLPLVPKNRHVPNKAHEEYNFVEGLFPKINHETNDFMFPPSASTSSTSENAHGNVNSPSSYPSVKGNANKDRPHGKPPGVTQINGLPLNGNLDTNFNEKFSIDGGALRHVISNASGEHEKNVTGLHDRRKGTQDRFMVTNMKARDLENSTSSVDCSASVVDQMFDDVVECEIPWDDLVLYERIGLGSYGEVYHADWNGKEVAVKKFLDQDFSGAALDEFKREVRIMRRLRHSNVVLFVGAVTRPPNLSIITEFLPRGSLYRLIHRPNSHIDEKRRIKMALDVAKGMNCLHSSTPTIVHRDLKSPNLLVDKNWNVKVCDFGLSRLKHNTFLSSKSTGGTPEWMAPEVLRNEPSNEKCDVYSFGVILWELATMRLPWSGMNPMQVVGAVGFQNRRLEIPKEVDPLVARIIYECWQTDPNLRPSFAQLIVALKALQCLQVPSHVDQQNPNLTPEVFVSSTP